MNTSTSVSAAAPITSGPPADSSAIMLSGVGFSYGERRALDGISLAIAKREMFGLLGPNGGGKTTLFKLLATLVPLQTGEVQVLGSDLRHDTIALRRRLGVVFQHPSVDGKLTVAENLAHHGRLYGLRGAHLRERGAAMLERVGLTARSADLVETLSGGLRRRVELAKALLHQPELLILDEPSTGLDPAARREFLNYLADLREREGITVVLTTHHMEEAERCDRIGVLDQGRLVALAAPGELKSRVGGDVVVIHASEPERLRDKIEQRMRVKAALVDGLLRVERPRGHEFLRDVVEAFGAEIESVTFGKPTLEDAFVHLTGRRFQWSAGEQAR
ncbi:MAG: ABC transporter ATP-binding protein [Candidatus Binataceae bacterium]